MLSRNRIDDAEPNAHPTLGCGDTKRVGLIHKTLTHNQKIPKSALSRRWSDVLADPKGFDCTYTYYSWAAIEGPCHSSALEHRFRSIATSARVRKWHGSEFLAGAATPAAYWE